MIYKQDDFPCCKHTFTYTYESSADTLGEPKAIDLNENNVVNKVTKEHP